MQQQQLTVHFILIVLKHSLITTFLQVPTARSATATSLQHTCVLLRKWEKHPSALLWPFSEGRKPVKSYWRAKDIFLHCPYPLCILNESWYKEDIKPNMDSLHLVLISRFMLCLVSTAIPLYSARCSSGIMGKDKFGLDQTWGENDSMLAWSLVGRIKSVGLQGF